jgi:hypothetical protein
MIRDGRMPTPAEARAEAAARAPAEGGGVHGFSARISTPPRLVKKPHAEQNSEPT